MGFPGGISGKELPANAGDVRDMVLMSGLGRSPGGELGNPLQYSFLENSMDRGACWATVPGIAESWTRLQQLSTQHIYTYIDQYGNSDTVVRLILSLFFTFS